jgi:MFS family permease
VGGVLGPTVSRLTVDALTPRFTGAYLALIVFVIVTMWLLTLIRVPHTAAEQGGSSGRPLRHIAAQPAFFVAVLCGALSYGVMNFLMTSTPLAMGACGHPYGDAAFVISSHVVAMFAPSFFTGGLIKRFGVVKVMLVGALLNLVAIGIALQGIAVANFWWSLVLIGVGWNFLYIGATALLTTAYTPAERAKSQGANESAIFVMMLFSSLFSGLIVTNAGWEKVNYAAAPLVAIVIGALLWLALRMRNGKAAA